MSDLSEKVSVEPERKGTGTGLPELSLPLRLTVICFVSPLLNLLMYLDIAFTL